MTLSHVDAVEGHFRHAKGTEDPAPLVALAAAVLIAISAVITLLSLIGCADYVPSVVRMTIVCAVALTLPGLPLAALLKLPSNGIFASVTVAVSIAANVLLSQLDFGLRVDQPHLQQFALLGVSAGAAVLLLRRWRSEAADHRPATILEVAKARVASVELTRSSLALIAGALVLFAVAVHRLDPGAAGRLGLIQALGLDYFAGLAILAAVLAIEYRRRRIQPAMLALTNVTLIGYLVLPVALSDRTAPFVTAYVHRTLTNVIVATGALPPPVDARTSWAGFFSAVAQLVTVGGLDDCGPMMLAASFVFGALAIFPVYAIGLAITGRPRVAWMGATVYTLFNWYQQDYFAPQAIAAQLYMTILAVLAWQMRAAVVPAIGGNVVERVRAAWRRMPGRAPDTDAGWTLAIELVLVLLVAAMVVSHQLTPVVTIVALFLFSAFGLTRYKLLWVVALAIFVAWFTYGAHDFWQGHLGAIVSDVGGVGNNLTSTVTKRISGDPVYSRMQYLRIAAALFLFATAFIGWLRLPRRRGWLLFGALAVAPFGLVAVQSYGGEVIIRCFIYASPVLAPLAASLLSTLIGRPARTVRQAWTWGAVAAGAFFALAVWVTADRGLNTSFERTTTEELAIADQLDAQTDTARLTNYGQGSLYGIPLQLEMGPECFQSGAVLADCTTRLGTDYVVDTRQDEKYREYRFSVPPSTFDDAIDEMTSRGGFDMIYDGHDVRVLKRANAPKLDLEFHQ
ncbi:hypothetical protein [Mycolicibacterium sp. 050158]|uniref:hypothetical protein n=1 Tax=Mycolicibacterium sp. 050158 TaxID=3090602 RepID=UPI00299E623F|nr:hypothetical protein [Mycolicibacterium sp. 050158]MDX1888265.1 hypothetical protein [Mycolicibacterium sp. 050158]